MKVGIIGSGGREHAICESLQNSNKINKIFCFPGNAGTAKIAENIILNLDNFSLLVEINSKKSLIYKHSIAYIKKI